MHGLGFILASFDPYPTTYLLGPFLYNPRAPRHTFSPASTKAYTGFKKILHNALSSVTFTDMFNTTFKVATQQHNMMDYIKVTIKSIDPSSPTPTIANISIRQQKSMSTHDLLRDLHIRLGHVSIDTIIQMSKKGIIKNLPPITKATPIQCHICNKCNIKRIPRGPTDTTNPPPFSVLHIDFMFYSTTSIRNFTAAFTIVDRGTSYPYIFPTTSKRPPIDIMRFLLTVLNRQGHEVHSIRADEDGALAGSAEFCTLLQNQFKIILQTTNGYESTINGKVERIHQTYHNMVRASLYTMQALIPPRFLPSDIHIQQFWCLAITYAAFIKRRLISARHNDSPYFLLHGKRPDMKDIHMFGAPCSIIKTDENKLAPKGTEGLFMGYGNTTKAPLFFNLSTRQLNRCHHLIVNDASHHPDMDNIFTSSTTDTPTLNLHDLQLNLQQTPFNSSEIFTYNLTLPIHATTIGFEIYDDTYFNIPYIHKIIPDTPAYEQIPSIHRRNMFIISINDEEPITSTFAIDLLQPRRLRSHASLTFKIQITKRQSSNRTRQQELRSTFDQVRPVIAATATNSPLHNIQPHPDLESTQLCLPDKPRPERFLHLNLKGPFRTQWIASLFQEYSKNNEIPAFSHPIHRSTLPKNTRIFPSRIANAIKPDVERPHVYTFRSRHTVDGSGMKEGIDYIYSYSPTASIDTIRIVIAISSSIGNILFILDIKNAFQTTLIPSSEQVYVSCPPFYLHWYFQMFRNNLPGTYRDYVLLALRNIQGKKDAGRAWYFLFVKVLTSYGFIPNPIDHCLFTKKISTGKYAYITLSTDDNLCSFPSEADFNDFKEYISKYFEHTFQSGNILHYLNMKITQSEHGISLDQTDAILQFLKHYFGTPEIIKTSKIPYSTDSNFEKELAATIPATPQQLQQLETQYKGSYRSLIGSLLYFANGTRPDLMYAISRLASYNAAPNSIAFAGIKRVLRYLAFKPHVPLYYPRHKLDSTNTVHLQFTPEKSSASTYPNYLTAHADSGMPHDLRDFRSTMCNIFTILGVSVAPQCKKTPTVPLHSTDAELRAAHHAIKRATAFRSLITSMGINLPHPVRLYQDNDAAKAIMSAGKMPSRTKHMGQLITYSQEKHNIGEIETYTEQTSSMLADFGTKPSTAPLLQRFHYWASGVRFYPPPSTQQFNDMKLQWFEQKYLTIINET